MRIFIKSSFLKLHQKVNIEKKVNFEKKSYGFREWGDVEKPAIEELVFEVICL